MSGRQRIPDTDWMVDGSCAARPDLPWLADTDRGTPWDYLTMRVICRDCPVRRPCRSFVRQAEVTGGFWAGVNRDPDAMPVPGLGGVA